MITLREKVDSISGRKDEAMDIASYAAGVAMCLVGGIACFEAVAKIIAYFRWKTAITIHKQHRNE